jgi:pyruvate dehydrogenase E1 component alpha subunit
MALAPTLIIKDSYCMNEKKTSTDQRVDAPVEEFSLISNETLFALYRNLLKCRMNSPRGNSRPVAHTWPFDAAAVAMASKLLPEDTVVSDSAHPALLTCKAPRRPGGTQARLTGVSEAGFSINLQTAIGAALAHRTKKTGRISVVFAGNDHGDAWTDALEITRIHRLPIIFVWDSKNHETNHGHSRRTRHAIDAEPGTELAHITADGNDVVAMYRVAHEAVERARRDRGPTLIECIPFRFGGSKHRDPLANMESYLRGKGLLRRGLKQELMEETARKSRK